MKRLIPLLTLLLAAAAYAQLNDISAGKFERKAKSLAAQDKDYASLTDDEKEFLVKAVAAKLAKIDAENHKGGKYKEKATGVNIRVILADTDLDEVHKKHPELKIKEKLGEIVSEKEWGDPGTPDKVIEEKPSLHVETVPSPDFHSLFADDDWEIENNPCVTDKVSEWVDDAVASAGKDGKVQHILIESSASRYKNTGKAEGLDFAQLSQRRAEHARDYLIGLLAAKGQVVSKEDVTIDALGRNKDGSSGPEPGKLPRKLDYDQFKYVKFSLYVAKVAEEKVPPVVIPGTPPDQHAEVVTFGLETKERCRFLRCITLPSFKIARRVSQRVSHKHRGSTDCPRW